MGFRPILVPRLGKVFAWVFLRPSASFFTVCNCARVEKEASKKEYRTLKITHNILLLSAVLLGLLGCGGDDENPSDDEDPLVKIVGTWELITIDGKTPKADFEQDADEETEVLDAARKIVFASDGALFQELTGTFRYLIESSPLIYLKMRMHVTAEGRYVVSGSTLEFILSGDDMKSEVDLSWETPGDPELKQRLEQGFDWQEREEEVKQEFEEEFKDQVLQLETYTFDLEGDYLTLMNESEEVFKKR